MGRLLLWVLSNTKCICLFRIRLEMYPGHIRIRNVSDTDMPPSRSIRITEPSSSALAVPAGLRQRGSATPPSCTIHLREAPPPWDGCSARYHRTLLFFSEVIIATDARWLVDQTCMRGVHGLHFSLTKSLSHVIEYHNLQDEQRFCR